MDGRPLLAQIRRYVQRSVFQRCNHVYGLCQQFRDADTAAFHRHGGGEALFGPSNYSILAQYHTDTRARAMSIHQTAYYVGVILAGWLAGLIADKLGWQYSFLIFGGVGVLWGILMIIRLDNKPAEASASAAESKPGFLDGFKTVFTTPTALVLTIGFSGLIFVITGFMTWVPAYLQEEFGQTQAEAGFNSMFWTYVAAFIGVLLAGSLSDRLALKESKYRMYLQAFGLLCGAVFLSFMGGDSSLAIVYCCFAGWGLFRAFFDANTYSVLYDVTPERLHASCASVMGMTRFCSRGLCPSDSWLHQTEHGLSQFDIPYTCDYLGRLRHTDVRGGKD